MPRIGTSLAWGALVTWITKVAVKVPGACLKVTWIWQLRPGSIVPLHVPVFSDAVVGPTG